mgnify:CR=1 FL=1
MWKNAVVHCFSIFPSIDILFQDYQDWDILLPEESVFVSEECRVLHRWTRGTPYCLRTGCMCNDREKNNVMSTWKRRFQFTS